MPWIQQQLGIITSDQIPAPSTQDVAEQKREALITATRAVTLCFVSHQSRRNRFCLKGIVLLHLEITIIWVNENSRRIQKEKKYPNHLCHLFPKNDCKNSPVRNLNFVSHLASASHNKSPKRNKGCKKRKKEHIIISISNRIK